MTFVLGAFVLGTAGWLLYVAKTVRSTEKARQGALREMRPSSEVLADLMTTAERLDENVVDWSEMFERVASRIDEIGGPAKRDGGAVAKRDESERNESKMDALLASSLTAPLSEVDFLTSYSVTSRLQRVAVSGRGSQAAAKLTDLVTAETSMLRLLGLDRQPTAVFLVPILEPGDTRTTALGTAVPKNMRSVAVEDVLATKATLNALLNQWPVDADDPWLQLVDPNTRIEVERRNILSFCAVRRNPATGWIIGDDAPASGIDVRLRKETNQYGRLIQWIDFEGKRLDSPSHNQERERDLDGSDLFAGPVDDYALIARVPNRLDPSGSTKSVVIAGLRAFGTWGAAEFLATRSEELYRKTEGRDFAAVVRVQARAVRVGDELRYENRPEVEITDYLRSIAA